MEGKDEGSLENQVTQKAVGGKLGSMLSGQFRQESTKLGSAKRELIPAIREFPKNKLPVFLPECRVALR
ncbi:MAG: hypothetical protein V2I97_24615 [Desulfococcaceae bacterium]|nr:hypothetical protein [Desulfococcaceae bacterium]